jgi:hypothetical protein
LVLHFKRTKMWDNVPARNLKICLVEREQEDGRGMT